MIAKGVVRSRTAGLPRFSYLRVSPRRICLLQHFALRPDRLIDIPTSALVDSPSVRGSWVQLEVAHEEGRLRVQLRPGERPLRMLVPAEPVLNLTTIQLRDLLDPR